MDDSLVGLVLVCGPEVAGKEPCEWVEPLHCGDDGYEYEVGHVPHADVHLLVREYVAAVVLVVVGAHHDVSEQAERALAAVGEHYGVAFAVGQVPGPVQTQHEHSGLCGHDDEHECGH